MKLKQKTELRLSAVHRFGVFAKRDINKGAVIEECPYLENHGEEEMDRNHEGIRDYLFGHNGGNSTILLLGYGSLYNHARRNNAEYYLDEEREVVEIHATRDIAKGEEIFIHYGERFWHSRDKKPK